MKTESKHLCMLDVASIFFEYLSDEVLELVYERLQEKSGKQLIV